MNILCRRATQSSGKRAIYAWTFAGSCHLLLVSSLVYILTFLAALPSFALPSGTYVAVSQPGMNLELADGDYDYWIETPQNIVDLQTGSYTISGNRIHFRPTASDIGDLNPSQATIIDECSFRWGKAGVFRLKGCKATTGNKAAHQRPIEQAKHTKPFRTSNSGLPKSWKTYRTGLFEIYIPSDCRVKVESDRQAIALSYNNGEAWLGINSPDETLLKKKALSGCNVQDILKKSDSTIYICRPGSSVAIVQTVNRHGERALSSFVKAGDMATFKALSISISSIRAERGSTSRGNISNPVAATFTKWTPSDRSFSIDIPKGWQVSGGTADLGANGYMRIVQAIAPDKAAGIIGIYAPVYQFAQMSFGSNGIPPEDPVTYIKGRFFQDLYQNFKISFDNLRFESAFVDEEASRKLDQVNRNAAARMGIAGNFNMDSKAVEARANFAYNNSPYEMLIVGAMVYYTFPAQGMGYMYNWGPAPIFLESAPKGQLSQWMSVFQRIAESWQVNWQWLSMHQKRASVDASQILKHYRKMARIIHENSERRLNQGMREWEAEEHEKTEELWDTFYALGGEERYDNPVTGEEIDVPTGADKYLYDNYSDTWVGIRKDVQGADELIRELKENGFVELRPHTH